MTPLGAKGRTTRHSSTAAPRQWRQRDASYGSVVVRSHDCVLCCVCAVVVGGSAARRGEGPTAADRTGGQQRRRDAQGAPADTQRGTADQRRQRAAMGTKRTSCLLRFPARACVVSVLWPVGLRCFLAFAACLLVFWPDKSRLRRNGAVRVCFQNHAAEHAHKHSSVHRKGQSRRWHTASPPSRSKLALRSHAKAPRRSHPCGLWVSSSVFVPLPRLSTSSLKAICCCNDVSN
jgi:hypothetical protein